MSTTHAGQTTPVSWPGQRLTATVDRALIHRRNPEEAFLTDVSRTGPDTFAAVALLPPDHPHYGGHTGPSRHLDPLLLLECARQAETYAAHALFGVELGAHFVLREWSAEFAVGPPGGRAGLTELLLTAQTGNAKTMGGRLRGLEYDFVLWTAGSRAGRVTMDVGYAAAAAYTALRRRRRGSAPPSSDTFVPLGGRPTDPAAVGRIRTTDVVLLDVTSPAAAAGPSKVRAGTARLRVPTENPSLFDHAQDHVPAMVLMEAARQFAVLAVAEWGGAGADRTRLVGLKAEFDAYAELDEPIDIIATPAVLSGASWSVDVTFRQSGADVARARTVVAVPGRARERGTPWGGPRS